MKKSIDASEYILCTQDVQKICDLNYLAKIETRIESCESLRKVPVSVFYPNSKLLKNRKAEDVGYIEKLIKISKCFKNIKNRKELADRYSPDL